MSDTLHGKPWEDLDTNPPRMDKLPDWAKDKAREWWEKRRRTSYPERWEDIDGLAALLVEVEEEEHACGGHIKAALDEQMAEVRRVVGEVKRKKMMVPFTRPSFDQWDRCCDEILSGLEKL